MDRNLALEFVRVTEAAAIAAAAWVGRGDKHRADGAAVDAMRSRLNQIDFKGTIVIGEGSKDEAPELYNGEKLGTGRGPVMDLAVDPLEATDSVAYGRSNSISVIAAGPKGSLLRGPDTYFDKIAAGPAAAQVIDMEAPVKVNIAKVAKALGKDKRELTVVVLDRERHKPLIEKIRRTGAKVKIITDGDLAGAIATCEPNSGIDLLMGIGASAEGVLAAVAMKILGGEILCRFMPRNESDVKAIKRMGVRNVNKVFRARDLAKGNTLTFTATGILEGPMLRGIVFEPSGKVITHSIVMRGESGTIRYITTHHHNY